MTVDTEERNLRMAQMRADIANKDVDSGYKLSLTRWEPWKAMATAFGGGAAFMAAAVALAALLLHK